MKVTLFVTCLVDMFETNVGKATVEVLERLGCEIEFPEAQVCCGQPAYNSGHVEAAKEAMKHMIETFEDAEYIVTPSGSCATMFHEYPHVFKDDPKWAKRTKVADKTYEFTQFIVDVLKVTDVGASLPGIATIHKSCHMTRMLGVKEAPGILLSNVKGLTVRDLPNVQNCCGFGERFQLR